MTSTIINPRDSLCGFHRPGVWSPARCRAWPSARKAGL